MASDWVSDQERNMRGKRDEQRKLDKFSELPDNVIDIILSRLPLKDAVRTSILSTKWRFHWTRVGNLVLDRDFFDDVLNFTRGDGWTTYNNIVNNILLSHGGPIPIHKFHLFVPDFGVSLEISNAINLWLLFVLSRGVQDLRLEHHRDHEHKVPFSIFQFSELKHLSLRGVKLPSHNFNGLSSLLNLDLYCDRTVGDSLTNLILKIPLLRRLSLRTDNNSGPFVVDASNLKFFRTEYLNGFDLVLKNTPMLSTIVLWLGPGGSENSIKCQDIITFFGVLPKIQKLTVSADILSEWAKLYVPERLPAPLEKITSLVVIRLSTYSAAHIRSMVCLLKSSSKLHTLEIFLELQPDLIRDDTLSQIRDMENFCSLRTVKIYNLTGEELEMAFIEMILSHSPILEKLHLIFPPSMHSSSELEMVTKIMRFRRASTQAEIIPDRW